MLGSCGFLLLLLKKTLKEKNLAQAEKPNNNNLPHQCIVSSCCCCAFSLSFFLFFFFFQGYFTHDRTKTKANLASSLLQPKLLFFFMFVCLLIFLLFIQCGCVPVVFYSCSIQFQCPFFFSPPSVCQLSVGA